jgi:nicotinamide-nucleotide amidase
MTIAILATGDEIIHGDTLNTNAHAIAHILCSEGLPLGMQLSCSDNKEDIVKGLQFLNTQHEIIVLIGGLGPTSDDRTRFALADFLGIELIEYTEALLHIENRFKLAGLTMNEGNHQQALFPPQSILLPNPMGTAMGCYHATNECVYVLLPGPPRECLAMFNQYVLPRLSNTRHSTKKIYKWRLFGVAEGEIAERLDKALKNIACETGYRLEMPYVEFKVRSEASDEKRIKEIIEPLVAPFIIAPPEYRASERLRDELRHLSEPISIIDEVTGGVLQTLLQKPFNHHLLHFYDKKECRIKFYISGLDAYWKDESSSLMSITIKYKNDRQEGSETYQLPFRSPLVVEYAAEWLSFRLFHLIDQLH